VDCGGLFQDSRPEHRRLQPEHGRPPAEAAVTGGSTLPTVGLLCLREVVIRAGGVVVDSSIRLSIEEVR